ncbi:MAG: hypothetical protein ACJATT_002417 [Myxococcota bacterium]|jgi:hypothetical protein
MWLALMLFACKTTAPLPTPVDDEPPVVESADTVLANVASVTVTGDSDSYIFGVGIRSDETGCDRYADWWEVVSEDGDLLFRRVLSHSHIGEQPFVRSGGPVDIADTERVWVRAHMSPDGYGGTAWFGSISDGFVETDPVADWDDLAEEAPQPGRCAF